MTARVWRRQWATGLVLVIAALGSWTALTVRPTTAQEAVEGDSAPLRLEKVRRRDLEVVIDPKIATRLGPSVVTAGLYFFDDSTAELLLEIERTRAGGRTLLWADATLRIRESQTSVSLKLGHLGPTASELIRLKDTQELTAELRRRREATLPATLELTLTRAAVQ